MAGAVAEDELPAPDWVIIRTGDGLGSSDKVFHDFEEVNGEKKSKCGLVSTSRCNVRRVTKDHAETWFNKCRRCYPDA